MTDRACQLITSALDQLSAALAAGHSASLTAVLSTMARFHPYSWSNQLLIGAQRPEATRVAGFRTWLSLGRTVRRGEKGIAILAPLLRRGRVEADGEDDRGERRLAGFRVVFVFDLSQTDGDPLPEFTAASGDPGAATGRSSSGSSRAASRADGSAALSERLLRSGPAYGGRIEVRDDIDQAETLTTLLHEAAHELLHRDPTIGRPTHVVRELEADAVACVVAESLGLRARSARNSAITCAGVNPSRMRPSAWRQPEAAIRFAVPNPLDFAACSSTDCAVRRSCVTAVSRSSAWSRRSASVRWWVVPEPDRRGAHPRRRTAGRDRLSRGATRAQLPV